MILQDAMGERSDATWAAKRVGISVPRQNGKSQLLVARALAGALLFGEKKIVISAHQQDTARESFTKLLEIIEADENDWLRSRIKHNGIMQALNREAIKFTSGATIQFKARSGAGSRGFSSDCLLLDEAQILSQRAWVSINSTMSAMPNPQVWLLGTPPTPEDDGAVFGALRSSAHGGKSSALAWLEWAAHPDDDPTSELTRWSANPAWNTRINHEVVQGEYETYPTERFALDRLGIWMSEMSSSVLPNWLSLSAPMPDKSPAALGVAADPNGTWLSLGAAIPGPRVHLGSVLRLPVARRAEFVAEVARVSRKHRCPVVIDKTGPASFVVNDLESAGVQVDLIGLDKFVQASVDLVTAVENDEVEHGDYADLNAAVVSAGWRKVGDRRVFARRNGDISSLEAVALAHSAAINVPDYDVLDSIF